MVAVRSQPAPLIRVVIICLVAALRGAVICVPKLGAAHHIAPAPAPCDRPPPIVINNPAIIPLYCCSPACAGHPITLHTTPQPELAHCLCRFVHNGASQPGPWSLVLYRIHTRCPSLNNVSTIQSSHSLCIPILYRPSPLVHVNPNLTHRL